MQTEKFSIPTYPALTIEFNIEGYTAYCQSLESNNNRGLLLYINSNIAASVVDIPQTFQECIFVMIKDSKHVNKLLIGNIYRNPKSSLENDNMLYELFKYVQKQFSVPKLIVGDFNFNNIIWKYDHGDDVNAVCSGLSDNELKIVNTVRENLFSQHIDRPTRQRGKDIPHTLDLVLSYDTLIQDIDYGSPLGLSDHSMLNFTCQLHIDYVRNTNKFRWDKRNYNLLNEFLDNINWDDTLDPSHCSVDTMWEKFKFIMMDGMNKYIPKSTQNETGTRKIFYPFMKQLHALVREKRRLWNRWMRSRKDKVFRKYKTIRNKVKNETVKLIQQEQEKVSLEYKVNPKKFWQYINRKNKTTVNIGDLKWKDFHGNDKVAETDTEKAIALEEFFTSVYTAESDDDFEHLPSRIQDRHIHIIMHDLEFTVDDIVDKTGKIEIK